MTVAISPGNEADDEGETVTVEDLSLLLLPFTRPHRSSRQMSPGMSFPIAFLWQLSPALVHVVSHISPSTELIMELLENSIKQQQCRD